MRFVTPEVVRIQLSNGTDWIEVRKHLTVGEEKRFRSAGMTRMSSADGKTSVEVDWARLALARAEAYITDWSAKKALSRDTIESLEVEDFDEIDKAIMAHIEAMAEAKKARASGEKTPQQ